MSDTSTIQLSPEDIDEMFRGARDMVGDVQRCIDRFNGVNLVELGAMSITFSTETIANGLRTLSDAVVGIVDFLTQLLSPGNPWKLMEMATSWMTIVGEVSGHISVVDPPVGFGAVASWEGYVGHAYRDLPALQAAALRRLKERAESFSTLVGDHATAVAAFWGGICSTVLMSQITLAQNAAEFVSADPFKWLDIVPHIAKVVSDSLKDLVGLGDVYLNHVLTTAEIWRTFSLDLADQEGTFQGSWPQISLGEPS
ncbi:hypothetical protein GCM10022198_18200 [Klugiella xanthotipulae]|uniref:Uncharacterized protein n=1 Tax=Klugiella xanthotipulae TaxID=244735 RepID=A0A543HRQ4_9MICO|nr:hypothetical protein [Klugiella xanthotipulae]TQM61023.1 hypothetical protein FB466_1950 [Klugiella xanthotipulae]